MYLMQSESFSPQGTIAFLRMSIGSMMIFHGIPKLIAGPERWAVLGEAMSSVGISFAPEFWGFMAGFTETGGGLFLAFGLFTRPWLILLMINMTVAFAAKLGQSGEFVEYSRPLEMLLVLFGFFLAGAGPFSLDNRFFGKNRNAHHDMRV